MGQSSLFAQYKREREGKNVIEGPEGFIIYSFNGPECYIEDIFIAKEFRGKGYPYAFEAEVIKDAKEAGCTVVTGTVDVTAKGVWQSLAMMRKAGYKVHSAHNNVIIFVKELKED